VIALQLLEEQVASFGHGVRSLDDVHAVERLGGLRADRATVDISNQWPQQRIAEEHEGYDERGLRQLAGAGKVAHGADDQSVAAVLMPRICAPSFMITPAPRNPMPETT